MVRIEITVVIKYLFDLEGLETASFQKLCKDHEKLQILNHNK